MPNLDFQQKVEQLVGALHKTVNAYLTGDFEVTVVCQLTDVDEPSGILVGSGDKQDALEVLEDHLEEEDESDIVVRSR